MSAIPDGSQGPSPSSTDPERSGLADSVEFLAQVIIAAIRDLTEEAHLHEWDILAVYNLPSRPARHPLMPGSIATTFVLIRCGYCHIPQTVELEGEWTEEQVKQGLTNSEEQ